MTRAPSHHAQHRRTIRVLAVVPGMREIGWAVGVRHRGGKAELSHWGVRNLPRGKTAFERIRIAQAWLDEEIVRLRVDEVRIVPPEPYHLTQRKNPSKLGILVLGLRCRVLLASCRYREIPRSPLRASTPPRTLPLIGRPRPRRRVSPAIAAACSPQPAARRTTRS